MKSLARRKFLQTLATGGAALGLANTGWARALNKQTLTAAADNRFKISLNAYSFNGPLTKGTTDLEAVMDFCAKTGFDAIDLTGYYFPGYPEVPTDEYIYRLKQKAHTLGLGISGTGIRNEFAEPNEARREAEILFVKKMDRCSGQIGSACYKGIQRKNHSCKSYMGTNRSMDHRCIPAMCGIWKTKRGHRSDAES